VITFRTNPQTKDFTTLADVKTALEITGSDEDAFLSDLIERASDEIVSFTNREFARAEVTETVVSVGVNKLVLNYRPVLVLTELRLDGTAITDTVNIINDVAGIIQRDDNRFESTQGKKSTLISTRIEYQDVPDWAVDYTGGFLMPGDDIAMDTNISASDADNSFNTTGVFPLLVAGDRIVVSGFTDPADNGTFTVISRTDTKIIVSATLVTEAAGSINMVVATLPKSLEWAAIEIVTSMFEARSRTRDLKSESIGDFSQSFFENSGAIPPSTRATLSRWSAVI